MNRPQRVLLVLGLLALCPLMLFSCRQTYYGQQWRFGWVKAAMIDNRWVLVEQAQLLYDYLAPDQKQEGRYRALALAKPGTILKLSDVQPLGEGGLDNGAIPARFLIPPGYEMSDDVPQDGKKRGEFHQLAAELAPAGIDLLDGSYHRVQWPSIDYVPNLAIAGIIAVVTALAMIVFRPLRDKPGQILSPFHRRVMWVAIPVLAAMLLYPPQVEYRHTFGGRERVNIYAKIGDGDAIRWDVLVAQLAVVGLLSGGLMLSARGRRLPKQEALAPIVDATAAVDPEVAPAPQVPLVPASTIESVGNDQQEDHDAEGQSHAMGNTLEQKTSPADAGISDSEASDVGQGKSRPRHKVFLGLAILGVLLQNFGIFGLLSSAVALVAGCLSSRNRLRTATIIIAALNIVWILVWAVILAHQQAETHRILEKLK